MNRRSPRPVRRSVGSPRCGRLAGTIIETLESRTMLATFTVSSVNDSGAGSLRQAILDANNTTGHDVIAFASSFYAAPRTISVVTPLPQMSGQLTVVGPGASLLTVRRDAGAATIFSVFNSTATILNLSGMTVTGGNTNGNGGGLQSTGPGGPNLTLDDMVFTGNSATGLGGGLYLNNGTTLTLRNSTISDNTAASGGGVYFFDGGSLVMENTTVSGNVTTGKTSGGGGGLYFFGAARPTPPTGFTPSTLVVRNSTFSGNSSARHGGAVMVETFTGTLLLQNSTLSGNTAATSGGGVAGVAGTGMIAVQNSTVAGNLANGTAPGAGGGGIWRTSTVGNALMVVNSVVSGNTNAAAPDILVDPFTTTQVNFSAVGSGSGFTLAGGSGNNLPFGTNPMLGPLANNGGPTQTRALLPGSPLINAASNANVPAELTTDQRGPGFARISGGTVDVGAFERDAIRPTVQPAEYVFLTAPRALRYVFSETVEASLRVGDLEIRNVATRETIPAGNIDLAYDRLTNTATFTFPGYPLGALPDGNYVATLSAAGVADPSMNALPGDVTLDFFVLAGDANRDRVVNFPDLLALATNYNRTGRLWTDGDFTGDGLVSFPDLLILANSYNKSLPAPAFVAAPARASATSAASSLLREPGASAPVFSTTRMPSPVPAAIKPKAAGRPARA